VQIEVPRDREGSFEPMIVSKRKRRLDGIENIVLSLSARGLTTGEISAHFAEVYDARVGKDTISGITDAVIEAMSEWQNRPLDRGRLPGDVHRGHRGRGPRRASRQPTVLRRRSRTPFTEWAQPRRELGLPVQDGHCQPRRLCARQCLATPTLTASTTRQ
jgi:hypothetical protein